MIIFYKFISLWIFISLLITLVWFIARFYKNPSIIDVFWPLGLWIMGAVYLSSSILNTIPLIFFSLLSIWACRLSSYLLFTRILKGIVDKRYLDLHQQNKQKWLSYFFNFQLQGIFILIISLPFVFISTSNRFAFLHYIAIILVISGIVGEFISDFQLQASKHTNSGKLCDNGLWFYSRHPNYFFDWLTWVGFALAALPQNHGIIAAISPLLLLFIMLKITVPLTEKLSIKSKGEEYEKYQKSTSIFFPRIKIRNFKRSDF